MSTAYDGQQAHILIIEDDANLLNNMREYLSRANFVIRTASTGWDALKRVKDGHVDLVISELSMSDMSGSELREKCTLIPHIRDIPFLFLVEEVQRDNYVRALRSGVDDCISKPFDPVILVARVQAVIERRQSYEQLVRVDPLTRLLNRPSLDKEVREELARLERYRRVASMVLLDVDDFDALNEKNGCALGDLLLTCLAGLILTNVRAMDVAGRFRGEKFLLLLPETEIEGAEILTRRIQGQLSAIAEAVAGVKLTFSAGIVIAPQDGCGLDILATRVEEAMLAAKAREKGSLAVWSRDAAGISPGDTAPSPEPSA